MDINKIIDIIPFLKSGSYFLKFVFLLWILSTSYLIFSFISYKLNEKEKKEEIETSKNQQINFSNFIDRLSNDSETIRNAAVLELGEISLKKDFQNKIIGILVSHIKENSEKLIKNADIYKLYKVKTDIQSALRIIGKRDINLDKDLNFDFKDLNFNGIILDSVDLSNMDFAGCQFIHSKITNSKLNSCELHNIDFRHSDLSNSQLKNSIICASKFELAKLNNCDFTDSHFGSSIFRYTEFQNANLKNTTMFITKFDNTDLSNVLNLNQEKLYWAFGSQTKLPENYILPKNQLLQVNIGKGYENRAPFLTGIGGEKKLLDSILQRK